MNETSVAAMTARATVLALCSALGGFGCQNDDASSGGICTTSGASGAVDAGALLDSSLTDAGPCLPGSWTLTENAGICGDCVGYQYTVGFVVSESVAAEGGILSDTDGNSWQFDPMTCVATLSGSCGAMDTVNFTTQTAICAVTCSNSGSPCAAPCTLTLSP